MLWTGRDWAYVFNTLALPVLAFTYLPSITPLHHSSSISLSEDGDEGTQPCEGLYLNVWV